MNNIKDIIKKEDIYCGNNPFVLLICGRLEKITIAVYMVTSFLSDEEPLKFNLRDKNIQLMSFINSIKDKNGSLNNNEFVLKISSLISEIISFLKIAHSINLVSEMNYSILVSEYKKFLNLIEEKKKEGEISFPENFFQDDKKFEDVSIGQKYKGHYIDKGQIYNIKDKIKKELEIKRTSGLGNNKIKYNQDKVDRRNLIIEIIKDNKEVSIKDIAGKIKKCSEKTIQREINILLKDNILKKEGERRWSRYSLN